MSLLTRLRRRSIDKRLLLLISGLLIATVSAFWWTAHRQIERVAFSSAGERLLGAANSIRGILEDFTSRHALALQRVATDPEVVGFLRSGVGHDAALAKAVASLRAADLVRIQLRDARGRIVLESSPSGITQGSGWIERSIQMGGVAAGEVRVSPIWRDGQTPYSETLTGVAFHDSIPAAGGEAATPALIGYISEVRPIVAQGLDAVRELVGPEAVLLVGMPGEGEWTDLEVPSKPPPATARVGEALVFDSSAWGLGVGAAAAIRGTPWVLWVHQPRALILASIQPLMVAMASLAVFFIVVGAFCAWLLGRWISRPIVRLTKEAEQMAMSETTPSHAIDNNLDEIERLTEAFARMSARVQDSHDAMAASERRFRSLIENAADPIT
ncbi:MAG: HAMP domain-containing protein, partial [Gemmatimonadaceae bacterium]